MTDLKYKTRDDDPCLYCKRLWKDHTYNDTFNHMPKHKGILKTCVTNGLSKEKRIS